MEKLLAESVRQAKAREDHRDSIDSTRRKISNSIDIFVVILHNH